VSSAVKGRGNKSKDSNFQDVQKKFDEQTANLKALSNDIVGFMSAADAILVSQKSMAENLLKVLPEKSAVANACNAQVETCDQMTATKKTTLETSLNAGFSIPLNSYQGQYREIADRIRERNRRESEMYKLTELRDKYKEKNDARLNATETKLHTATLQYEDLNRELIEDIPKLIADSESFFQPLIYQLILNQAAYWNAMAQHASTLSGRIDQSLAGMPQITQVITPKQSSAMTKKYAAAANPWASDMGGNKPALGAPPTNNPWGAPPGIDTGNTGGVSPRPSTSAPNPFGGGGGTATPFGQAAGAMPLPARPPRAVPPPAGAQAKGLWDFHGQDHTELSFKAGEILTIVEKNGDWWTGELAGRRGLLPANYVQLL